jgi:FSR family fosmidomycin resistance protein-like MFS transporter
LVLLPFLQKSLALSLVDIGLLSSVLTVASIVSAFFASWINDRFGFRTSMLFSIGLFCFVWFGVVFIHTPGVIWILYAVGGISAGLFDPIASALIARVSDKKLGSAIGDYAAAGDLGRVGMTALTTLLVGLITLFYSSLLYGISAGVVLLIYLSVSKSSPQVHVQKEKGPSASSIVALLRNRKYCTAMLVNVFDVFSSVSLFIFLPFLLTPKGITLESTGLFTALFFIGFFFGRMLLGRFSDKHGAPVVLIVAEIVMAALILSLVFFSSYWILLCNIFLLGVVARGTSPVTKVMIAESIEKHDIEKGFSLASSAVRTANAVGRSLFGFIGALWGVQSIFYVCAFFALITVLPCIVYLTDTSPHRSPPSV